MVTLFAARVSRGACLAVALLASSTAAAVAESVEYRVLATNKTSTMEKEMQEAAAAGFRFAGTMGGETAFGGNEVAVVMTRIGKAAPRYEYRLLATTKTSTMQRELSDTGAQGFEFVGMTVGSTAMGGSELVTITRRKVQ
jgi:hypothetical protein